MTPYNRLNFSRTPSSGSLKYDIMGIKEKRTMTYVKKTRYNTGLPVFNPYAAGIDIGDSIHDVAISNGKGGHIVREYGTFTCDLESIVSWLLEERINTVAIESTGIYWISLYLMLEEAGIEPYLVNARYAKNVSGRKKDDSDAIWLQKLHSCGLLQKSFQPNSEYRILRDYVRQRKKNLQLGADNVRRMQKSLELMNIKIHTVISDILGKTGMLIIEAILNGERNSLELLKLKDSRIKASEEDIIKSLNGIWKEEYLFTLQQAYDAYMFYQKQAKACEIKIEEQLIKQVAILKDGDITEIQRNNKSIKYKKNSYSFDVRSLLHIIVGVDLCRVDAISEITAIEIISEIGVDMSKWSNYSRFSAWLNLVPNTKITGGKIISSKMRKRKNTAGISLRMAASNLSKRKSQLGDYSRKLKSRIGKKGAVVASAHKLAKIIYTMIKKQKEFSEQIIFKDQIASNKNIIKALERKLAHLKSSA